MCGIIGIAGKLPNESTVARARDALAHRGPDDAGIYYDAECGIALGSRRLSILDLTSAGHQPMRSQDGRFVIVFNGEIYNYLELKEELERSYPFRTKTDTEVLLAAYARWGPPCLAKLNGMFAFAIYDTRERTLFAARDRLGEKPFYYHWNPATGAFSFASEIKALLALGVAREPNEEIIYDYLYHGLYHHSAETFFAAIRELRGGHYLVRNASGISIKKYWDLAAVAPRSAAASAREVEEQFRDLVADAIRLRFRSDVPVGINLSSGLDSNSLRYYAKQVTGHDTETFSMCMPSDPRYNECAFIEGLLDAEGRTRWHTSSFTPDQVFAGAEAMNAIQDQPYGGIPTIMYAGINAVAKERGVTVLLEGQGIDEILAGYKYFTLEHERDLREASNPGSGAGATSSLEYSQDMSPLIERSILNPAFTERHGGRALNFRAPFASHLLNAQYRDIVYTKLPRVLHFNDHVSMAYSRELRLPFLDHRIVEFCFSLPAQYKIANGEQKVLMRNAMAALLPPEVQRKPKVAFGAVQTDWLKTHFRDQVYALLDSPAFRARPYWDHEKLRAAVDEFYRGGRDNSFFIWQAINLEMWLRKFID